VSNITNYCVYRVLYPLDHIFASEPCYLGQGKPERPYRDFTHHTENPGLSQLARNTDAPLRVEIILDKLTQKESLEIEASLISRIRSNPDSAPLFNTNNTRSRRTYKPQVDRVKDEEAETLIWELRTGLVEYKNTKPKISFKEAMAILHENGLFPKLSREEAIHKRIYTKRRDEAARVAKYKETMRARRERAA